VIRLQGLGSMNICTRATAFLFVLLMACTLAPGIAHAKPTPAWLLLSDTGEDSLMTLGAEEKDTLVKAGWTIEGQGMVESENVEGSALLHRMVRSTAKGTDRRLEYDPAEVAKSKDAGFTVEGWLGFVKTSRGPGQLAVVQLARDEKRMWVCKTSSQRAAEDKGWKRERVQFWIWAVKSPEDSPPKSGAPR